MLISKRSLLLCLIFVLFMGIIVGCSNVEPLLEETDKASLENKFNEGSMKTIGMIGGVSWVSTADYYQIMNQEVASRLGKLYSANILLYSIEFGEFSQQEKLAAEADWDPLRNTMLDAAMRLKSGGADFIIICSNTLNSTAELLEEKTGLKVLHIADAVGEAVRAEGIKRVALLGTAYTMEEDFYRMHLINNYDLEVVIPKKEERVYINEVIFEELCADHFTPEAKEGFRVIIERMVQEDGVEGVILGCTEIPLLISQEDISIPAFNSTAIHAKAAVNYALSD